MLLPFTCSVCAILCCSAFIGQGADKNKEKGMDKKQQRAVLNGFTDGKYNVLVATCIGEEGLDIPEVCKHLPGGVLHIPVEPRLYSPGKTAERQYDFLTFLKYLSVCQYPMLSSQGLCRLSCAPGCHTHAALIAVRCEEQIEHVALESTDPCMMYSPLAMMPGGPDRLLGCCRITITCTATCGPDRPPPPGASGVPAV